jgi:hypothetical protein
MESTTQHKSDAELSNSSLLFVYNADTGLFSVVTDYAHKILSPKTYPCNLCAITYGSMGMNKKWEEFIANLSIPVEFLHRDEFVKHNDFKDTQLPAAFLKKGDTITMLITHDEINKCTTIEELMDLVMGKLGGME